VNFLLIMRKAYRIHLDHIQTLRNLGARLHLVTEVDGATDDPRFTSVTLLPAGAPLAECVERAASVGRMHAVDAAITFQETDIVVTAEVNRLLGRSSVTPRAARIARNKAEQRRFLASAGIPSVAFAEVSSVSDGMRAAERLGYPLIVKPTQAASSWNVALVRGPEQLRPELERIGHLARSGRGRYYDGSEATFALVEEFLPGDEITVDGVVCEGRFVLGGVHDKMRTCGPYFEEDLYTLPFRTPEREAEVTRIAEAITRHLGLQQSLLNIEMRQDATGAFRVVEFSPRISGGHVYRNIRDVYGIDLVGVWAENLASPGRATNGGAPSLERTAPRMATCIKFVYRTGRIQRNSPGDAYHSPHYLAYFPVAEIGRRIARPPEGFDIAGLLSIGAPYRDDSTLDTIRTIALDVERQLDLVTEP
jgi:biotin carboxylase